MDLAEKIGQLFLLGFQGREISSNDPIAIDIREGNLGGVILFDRFLSENRENNIASAAQLQKLTSSLQNLTRTPLLVSIDQEGGQVSRLKAERGFPQTTSPAVLGQLDDSTQTYLNSLVVADMLKHLGINFNLAPVVDLNINPDNPVIGNFDRSFSGDPEVVTRHTISWVKGHRERQILTCLKHFPGHGSSKVDSHLGFTDVSEAWIKDELLPYQKLIDSKYADAIMTGHLFLRDLDPDYPATLSKPILEKLLRQHLNYEGVIVSDDLQMKAISDHYGLEKAICLAFNAGVDIVIIGNNLQYQPHILENAKKAVLAAVQAGELSAERLYESCQRVERLKRRI